MQTRFRTPNSMAPLLRVLLYSLAGVFLVAAMSSNADAKKKKKTGKQLASVLDELTWGESSKNVMAHFEAKIMEDFKVEEAEISDLGKRDKLRKTYKKRVEFMKKSFKELKSGKRTGLEVSIVGGEFAVDNGESVLVLKEDVATKYYFFLDDELYKVAIAYKPSYVGKLDFFTFVDAVARKYGNPTDQVLDEDGFLMEAMWKDKEGSQLITYDMVDVYDTYLMSFSDVGRSERVAEKHAAVKASLEVEPDVTSDIDDLTEGDDDTSTSAADDVIGQKTEVDIRRGLPQEDLDELDEAAKVDESKQNDKGGTSKKKKKKRKRKRKGAKKGKFDGIERKKEKDSGVVIY